MNESNEDSFKTDLGSERSLMKGRKRTSTSVGTAFASPEPAGSKRDALGTAANGVTSDSHNELYPYRSEAGMRQSHAVTSTVIDGSRGMSARTACRSGSADALSRIKMPPPRLGEEFGGCSVIDLGAVAGGAFSSLESTAAF
jgi:hypothetical protein